MSAVPSPPAGRGGSAVPSPPAGRRDPVRVVSPTMVGRAAEQERARHALLAPPAVVRIEGDAGIGKTRMIRELAALPELSDRCWAVGACRGIREPFPLGPVLEAIRAPAAAVDPAALSPVAGALRPLLPELDAVLPAMLPSLPDRAAERHRTFRALTEVLTALGPTVLVLEDLHWADDQTIEFIMYLLGAAPAELSLLLTFRGPEAPVAVRTLATRVPDGVSGADLTLPPLTAEQTRQMAAAILENSQVSSDFAAHLCRRSSGLPLAIEEFLALLGAQGTLVEQGGGAAHEALDQLAVPGSLRGLTLERIGRLSADARAVVEAAAVLQTPTPPAVVGEVCGLPPPRMLAAIDEALAGGLLVEHGSDLGFRHLLAAQAVYDATSGARRRDLHDRASEALARLQPPPLGQIAHHLRHAARVEAWVGAAERAADQAVALGDDAEAARLLRDLLEHAPFEDRHRGRVAIKFARTAIQTVHVTAEVTELLSGILRADLPDPVRGELIFRLALLCEVVGADAAVIRQHYTEAVALLDRADLRAWAMTGLAIPTAPPSVHVAEHEQWLSRALAVLPDLDDPPFEVFLLGKAAMVEAAVGHPQWRQLCQRIDDLTGGDPRHRGEVIAYQSVSLAACYAGHCRDADRLLQAASRGLAAHRGAADLELRVRSARAALDFHTGRWDGLAELAGRLREQLVDHPLARIDIELVAAYLALAQGEGAGARQRLAAVADRAEGIGGYEAVTIAVDALGRLAIHLGRPAAVLPRLRRVVDRMTAKGWWLPVTRMLPTAVEVLVGAGFPDEAGELTSQAETGLGGRDAPLAEPSLLAARALLSSATGRSAGAAGAAGVAEVHERAAASYHMRDAPYQAAQEWEHAALAWYAAGDAGRAVSHLRQALDGYAELGAGWDSARVARLARQRGVPVPARRPTGRRGYGDQLSPRERQVAELAAGGRTNRQIARELFLSPKTVDKHISAALRKLGAPSRSALARYLDGD